MQFWAIVKRTLILIFAILIVAVFIIPCLIPVPPLEGAVEPRKLADAESRFLDVEGLMIHYKQKGDSAPNLILLHGLGASLFTWHAVMGPLGKFGTVTAYDRPAFGLTERPLLENIQGDNPYSRDNQPDLLVSLMDNLGIESAILMGNSAGGAVALQTALKYPERVKALILVDPALLTLGGPPAFLQFLYRIPSIDRVGPLIMRSAANRADEFLARAFHDPLKITAQMREGYREPLRTENWDQALWEFLKAAGPLDLESRLGDLEMPTLIITGDDDQIVPTAETIKAAGMIRGAELVVIPDCGHVPQEECPQQFMQAVESFLENLNEEESND